MRLRCAPRRDQNDTPTSSCSTWLGTLGTSTSSESSFAQDFISGNPEDFEALELDTAGNRENDTEVIHFLQESLSPSTHSDGEEMSAQGHDDGGAHGLEDGDFLSFFRAHGLEDEDSHSLFQVETLMPVRTFDESILEMWSVHTEVRGLDRLNMDAMAYLWMERTAPVLRIRHVDFKYRTWMAAWGDTMALTPETLIPKVRAALHDDFAPSVDLWVGAVTPQPDQALQGHQDHFEILVQGGTGGVPSLAILHYGTLARPHTRNVPISTGNLVSCVEVLISAGASNVCSAPGMQCPCFLEDIAPFHDDNVVLRGWQRIDVYVSEVTEICTTTQFSGDSNFAFEDDVVTLFDLGQHETAGSSWADARQVLFDRVMFHAEMDDTFEALVANVVGLSQIVLFLADGQDAMFGFVTQNWHGQSLLGMVERRWEHLRGLQWDFMVLRLMPSMFDYHGRMLLLVVPPVVINSQDSHPAVVIEWTFQLRWACAAFFEARTLPLLITREELLSLFLTEVPAQMDVRVDINGIRQPPYGRMHLRGRHTCGVQMAAGPVAFHGFGGNGSG